MSASAFPPGHPRHIPESWPMMLSRDQASAFAGVCEDTFARICPVQPRDLGANVVRYFRPDLEAWLASLPPRLKGLQPKGVSGEHAPPAAPADHDPGEERRSASLDRARRRMSGGARCRTTAVN